MRAYMYAYGYKHLENAYAVMAAHGLSSDPCSDCDGCTVQCPKDVMVADRIAGVSRLMELPGDMLV